MKNKYWIAVILFFAVTKLYGQDVRVGNNFIILVDDKLLTTSVASFKLILTDTTGKEESISAGYTPGELSVNTIEAKNVLFGDSVRTLTLTFDHYEYRRDKQFIHNYKIFIDRKWFKQSVIILRITIISKKKGTYKYSFEVPGYTFAKPGYVLGK